MNKCRLQLIVVNMNIFYLTVDKRKFDVGVQLSSSPYRRVWELHDTLYMYRLLKKGFQHLKWSLILPLSS